ncbi:MAG: ABC transporter, partial [Micrococcales bacterium]|nr:ABC transporter [Micrococcales bacterium]
ADLRGSTRTVIHAVVGRPPGAEVLAALGDVSVDGDHVTATVACDQVGEAMAALVGCQIASLTVEPPSLESLFLSLYDEASQ